MNMNNYLARQFRRAYEVDREKRPSAAAGWLWLGVGFFTLPIPFIGIPLLIVGVVKLLKG